ncbi:MAG: putative zinc-binding metallopeptidase [Gammaproteobacteria bacterium]|nr:putative zinc-binding metallopeptidase [Gammaproteobacteria bacterium]
MKTFHCVCGNTLYFENSMCLKCGRELGFIVEERFVGPIEPASESSWRSLDNGKLYRKCYNNTKYQVCNWLVPIDDENQYCVSCRLNHIIPNLTEERNLNLWYRIETAKRRLIYTLKGLGLPLLGRSQNNINGLAFQFMENESPVDEFDSNLSEHHHVMTGHTAGMITINIVEAEHSSREEIREKMNERYRTLIGHFRHESGHYYWQLLVSSDSQRLSDFRRLFGDERQNYNKALSHYYNKGPRYDWPDDCISAYASSHPWEDWAETWAHYLHMIDTLETAEDYGFVQVQSPQTSDTVTAPHSLRDLLLVWERLALGLNSLNRSLGLTDAYPFSITEPVAQKLQFIHTLIQDTVSSN